eukprot:CAMPEP_0170575392 /NCGR_PEP_ID=MMETSP0224-20130122/3839_1 /TAXON_ID=285029 /ORGANISM="Togula jolla, Strain CCCM 725" /LENGTH=105 /DNA_ID=CAMNT_0010898173 /DNA_START=910 /DNA_END=1224 /DNA_ORIENTATION=+
MGIRGTDALPHQSPLISGESSLSGSKEMSRVPALAVQKVISIPELRKIDLVTSVIADDVIVVATKPRSKALVRSGAAAAVVIVVVYCPDHTALLQCIIPPTRHAS